MISGQCYCGAAKVTSERDPLCVVYCHCSDCRRISGAPVAVLVAFEAEALRVEAEELREVSISKGVVRSFCGRCGSSLAGVYGYLPDQVYVPIGILDQADALVPEVHAHSESRLDWFHVADDLERLEGSSRSLLRGFGEHP